MCNIKVLTWCNLWPYFLFNVFYAKFEIHFSYHKTTCIWIAATVYCNILLPNCAISVDSCTSIKNRSINKFFSFITFNLQINVVILQLNCLDLIIFYFHLHLLFIKCYFCYTFTYLKLPLLERLLIFVLLHLFYISFLMCLLDTYATLQYNMLNYNINL